MLNLINDTLDRYLNIAEHNRIEILSISKNNNTIYVKFTESFMPTLYRLEINTFLSIHKQSITQRCLIKIGYAMGQFIAPDIHIDLGDSLERK